jgi:hypothetical protein
VSRSPGFAEAIMTEEERPMSATKVQKEPPARRIAIELEGSDHDG